MSLHTTSLHFTERLCLLGSEIIDHLNNEDQPGGEVFFVCILLYFLEDTKLCSNVQSMEDVRDLQADLDTPRVASGLMIAVGLYAKLCKETGVVDSLTADPAILLIVVGMLMFIITFFGCMGALRDVHLLLKIFAGMLIVVLILQLVAAVLGFMFSGMVLDKASSVMARAIIYYREDLDLQNFIDYIQKKEAHLKLAFILVAYVYACLDELDLFLNLPKFECCGVNSYKDWSTNIYFYCTDTNPSLERCGVPFSCCIKEKGQFVINTMCGYETQNLMSWHVEDRIFVEGCLEKIVSWGRGNLLFLAYIALGLIFLEIVVIGLAVVLIYQINFIMERRKSTAVVKTRPEAEEDIVPHMEPMHIDECQYIQ